MKIFKNKNKFFLHYGDLLDPNSLTNIIKNVKPDEIYNFAAQSHVGVSFQVTKLYVSSKFYRNT